jgi:fibronectin type 3 domain-containing protein
MHLRRTSALVTAAALALAAVPLAAGPASAAGRDYLFDFQCAGNPTAAGYTAVYGNTGYSASTGFGFQTPLAANACRDRGGSDPALNDFVLPVAGTTFLADVPDGTYTVILRTGDGIATSNSGATVGGIAVPARRADSGVVDERVLDGVRVTGGQLAIVMSGSSIRLNSIQILQPVAAPTGVTATVTATSTEASVGLAWPVVDGAAGYRVYRSDAGGTAVAVGTVDAPAFTDTDVQLAGQYTYAVSTVGSTGRESVRSPEVSATVVDPAVAPPAAPTGATGSWGADGVALTWTAVPGAVAYDVSRARSGLEPVVVARTTDPTWTDATAQATVDYVYRIAAVGPGGRSDASADVTIARSIQYVRQAERLDRSPVAVATDGGVYVGWRLLGLDDQDLAFHVYRDGVRITTTPVTGSTNVLDPAGTASSTYRISTVVAGIERWATEPFAVWDQQTMDVPISKPADGTTPAGEAYTYRANDASIGDVDGDGQYEIILKWDPSNSKDNSQAGYTGNVYVDAYELDGTQLWRIDLGRNIRAGAHYTQMQVFDLDGDGKAEVTMKTADATIDGAGTVIGDANADFRNSSGYILSGPEFLTVFNGRTGAAIDTIDYTPPRGNVGAWGDTYGNRVDRFLAGIAYLDGQHPSVIFSRGYYTRAVIAAYDFDGTSLTSRWTFDSDVEGSQYRGMGNHQFSVADVDGDQKDEIVFGSQTIDDNGKALYTTGLGHGDALHVSDLDPSRPGLEVFAAHEDMASSGNRGATFRDAATGEVLWSIPATKDTGRAAAGDIDPRYLGAEGWAVGGDAAWNSPVGELRSAKGELLSTKIPAANFLTWWDGDLLREIGDHDYSESAAAGVPTIAKWNWETQTSDEIYRATGTLSNNTTKGNPSLQADLFGDWREEIVTRLDDSSALRIATTVDLTDHRLRTLQSDPVYRQGAAAQNTAYNQPPHTSYYLGEGMTTPPAPSIAYTQPLPVGDRVPGPATAAPGTGVLSSDNWDGDGSFQVSMNMWWGQNAQSVTFYENGVALATQDLVDATPGAQSAALQVAGRANGTYVYTAVLTNARGSSTTRALTVTVDKANPATPVLSHDNWDGDGSYTLTTNLWWGTNATEYRLYEDGALIDTQSLTANGFNAQQATTTVTGRSVGTHVYRAELVNPQGSSSSQEVAVKVTR